MNGKFVGIGDINEYLGPTAGNYNREAIVSEYNQLIDQGRTIQFHMMHWLCKKHMRKPAFVITVGFDYVDDAFVVYVVKTSSRFEVLETITVPSGSEGDAWVVAYRVASERGSEVVQPNSGLLYGVDE
jgi:hypothetical protein